MQYGGEGVLGSIYMTWEEACKALEHRKKGALYWLRCLLNGGSWNGIEHL